MNASAAPAPRTAAARLSISRLIAAWPTYLTGPVQVRPYNVAVLEPLCRAALAAALALAA
jgi:hypothetical protein